MVAAWRRVAYTYADLEDEVEICIMSLCGAVVKSGYPLESDDGALAGRGAGSLLRS